MKHIFAILINATIGATIMSYPLNAKDLQLEIHNIDTQRPGNILVMLFERNGFPKNHKEALETHVLAADYSILSTTFEHVPDEFSIKVLHDEDGSKTVTKNWTGIFPAEGLGFSNGAKLKFGPPTFDDAKLTLSDVSQPHIVNLIYP